MGEVKIAGAVWVKRPDFLRSILEDNFVYKYESQSKREHTIRR